MSDVIPPTAKPPIYKSPWVWGFIIGAVALTALRPLQESMLRAPEPIASPGAWALVDDTGAAFGSENLKGKVWVGDFMFTRCRSVCIDLLKAMKTIETNTQRHGDKLHLVSISVDPAHDTPDVMAAYREKFDAKSPRWTFVTGPIEKVHNLVVERLPFHIGEVKKLPNPDKKSPEEELIEISHHGKLGLFDQNGDLRAVFTTDEEGLTALGAAASLLIKKGPTP